MKSLRLASLLAFGFTLGALLGRRWKGDVADNVLSIIALLTISLLLTTFGPLLWERRWRLWEWWVSLGPKRPVAADAGQAGELPIQERRPSSLVALLKQPRVLRIPAWGPWEYVEISLDIPESWKGAVNSLTKRARELEARLVRWDESGRLPWALFLFSLGLYALTRLWQLDQFPIYFFSDEAIQPVLASDLIRNGFRNSQGLLFPSYFKNGSYWNLSLSVYVHALTVFLFGKSIEVTRATSALLTLSGSAAVALIMKWFFQARWWWIVVLFLTVTPAWFVHSRTAFEAAMMVSFYAWFLLCYLLYRYRSPNYLYPALVFGAAAFYTYAAGQAVMAFIGILLLVFDLRYHLRHWRSTIWGVGWLMLLLVPYARFRLTVPQGLESQLGSLHSYWFDPISLPEKLLRLLTTYLSGLDPRYWFLPNEQELIRHQMKGYSNLALGILPFFLIGLFVCLRRIRSSAHRLVLLVALAAPFGAALVDVGITRVLTFVIPANIFAALGFERVVQALRGALARRALGAASAMVLTIMGLYMLNDALVNGPTWYQSYGLYGMQWGAKQLFQEAIPEYMQAHPTERIYVTPVWANGTDVFLPFFDLPKRRVEIGNIDPYLQDEQSPDAGGIMVMTEEERDRAEASAKFKPLEIERTIKYPNGKDAFYFAKVAYVDNVDAIFVAERERRERMITDTALLNGDEIQVAHSPFDLGSVQNMFDGNLTSVARGAEANPLIVDVELPSARRVRTLALTFGQMDFRLLVQIYADDSQPPIQYTGEYRSLPGEPHVEIPLVNGPFSVKRIHLEIQNLKGGPAHIHVREIELR